MWPGVCVGVGVGVGVTVAGVELNNNTALTTQSERRFLNTKVTVAGVELNNNTAPNLKEKKILDVKTSNFRNKHTKTRNNSQQKWRNCGWSETRQQHSKHETKRTVNIYDVKTYKK